MSACHDDNWKNSSGGSDVGPMSVTISVDGEDTPDACNNNSAGSDVINVDGEQTPGAFNRPWAYKIIPGDREYRICFNCGTATDNRFNVRMNSSELTIQQVFGKQERPHSCVCYLCFKFFELHTGRPLRYGRRRLPRECVFKTLPSSEYAPNACKKCKPKNVKKKWMKPNLTQCFNCGTDADTRFDVSSNFQESVIQKLFGKAERPHNHTCIPCMSFLRHHTFDDSNGQRSLNPKCTFRTLPSNEYTPRACKGFCGNWYEVAKKAFLMSYPGTKTHVNDDINDNMVLDDIEFEGDVALHTFRRDENEHTYAVDTIRCFGCGNEYAVFNALEIAPESVIQEVLNVQHRKHAMICSKCSDKIKTHLDRTNAKIKAAQKKEMLLKLVEETKYQRIVCALGTKCWRSTLTVAGIIIKQELQTLPLCEEIITELCDVAFQVIDKLENDLALEVPRTKLLLSRIFKPWLVIDQQPTKAEPPTRVKSSRYNFKQPNPTNIYTDCGITFPRSKTTSGSSGSSSLCKEMGKSGGDSRLGNPEASISTEKSSSRNLDKQGLQKRKLVHKVKKPTVVYKERTPNNNLNSNATEIITNDAIVQESLDESVVVDTVTRSKPLDISKENGNSLSRTETSIHTQHKCDPNFSKKTLKCTKDMLTVTRGTTISTDDSEPVGITHNENKHSSVTYKSDTTNKTSEDLSNSGSRIYKQKTKSKRIARKVGRPSKNNELIDDGATCKGPKRTNSCSPTSDLKFNSKRRRKTVDVSSLDTVEANNLWGTNILLPTLKKNKSDTGSAANSINHSPHENQPTDPPICISHVHIPMVKATDSASENDQTPLKNNVCNELEIGVTSSQNDLVPHSNQRVADDVDVFYDTVVIVLSDAEETENVQESFDESVVVDSVTTNKPMDISFENDNCLRRTETSIHIQQKCDPNFTKKTFKCTKNNLTVTVSADDATPVSITKKENKNSLVTCKPDTSNKTSEDLSKDGSPVYRQRTTSKRVTRKVGRPRKKGPQRTRIRRPSSGLKHNLKRRCKNVDESFMVETDVSTDSASENDQTHMKNNVYNELEMGVTSSQNDLVPRSNQRVADDVDLFCDTVVMVLSDAEDTEIISVV